MGSRGIASYNEPDSTPPSKKSLPTRFVRGFRERLATALDTPDPASGTKLGRCIGVDAFYDYDDEPIYVGQTTEDFATRIGRHLRGQQSDTLAYRILDPFEVARMELFPAEFVRELPKKERSAQIDALEYSVYIHAIEESKYKAILNEKIPPVSPWLIFLRHIHSISSRRTFGRTASTRTCVSLDGPKPSLEWPLLLMSAARCRMAYVE